MKTPRGVVRVDRAVAAALSRAGYSGKDIKLVVAVSGGPDSSALLYSLHRLSSEHRLKLHVAHLNHDIRGEESEEDAEFVRSLAQTLDLPATLEEEDPVKYQREHHISSFEQATREMRYSFLLGVARRQGAPAVAVGHTADDQAETVLEHILRGSGIHGLRGMTEVAPWPWPTGAGDVSVFRPLLTLAKSETVAYCRALGKEFRQDSDNYRPQFTRNRVRHELLPLLAAEYNPRVTDALVRLSNIAGLELDYLEGECDRLWAEVVEPIPGPVGDIRFRRTALSALHPALQRLLLRRGYLAITGDTRRLRESHLSDLSEALGRGGAGFRIGLPQGTWVHATSDELVFSKRQQLSCPLPPLEGEHLLPTPETFDTPQVTSAGDWKITARLVAVRSQKNWPTNEEYSVLLSNNAVGKELWIRSRRRGDRFQPLGMSTAKKLQDFFVDSKVPRDWRNNIPLVATPRGIAWVVGYRIAEWAKVSPDETTALRITFSR